ncbi:MAG: ABC transporter ATP-binding protein [Desulfovibrionaceae bacterium]
MSVKNILTVHDLTVRFSTDSYTFDAVSQVNFNLVGGQTTCLVGESGCGKSLTAKALLRLIPPTGSLSGRIVFEGQDLMTLSEEHMRRLRGNRMSMIFQEPMTALNPVLQVGDQVAEPLRLHKNMSAPEALLRAGELFQQVGIAAAHSRLQDYPHLMSGGMRQRVMIAMALACEPQLLLADEPTTALDVTIQGQILQLLKKLTCDRGMAMLLITHDLGVVAQMADTVVVMYAGRMVEEAPVRELFTQTLHPYTRGLMHAAPTRESMLTRRLPSIKGTVPSPDTMPTGCPFAPRCPEAQLRCTTQSPPLHQESGHKVYCWLHA